MESFAAGDDFEEYFENVAASEERRRAGLFTVIFTADIADNIKGFEVTIPVFEDEERRLNEIEPPEKVAPLHADYLASRAEVLRLARAILSRLNGDPRRPNRGVQLRVPRTVQRYQTGIAGCANYRQSATSSCQRLSDLAVANGFDSLRCAEQSEIDGPLATVSSSSCEDRPTRGASSQKTRTQFINETDRLLHLFENDATFYVVELEPGETETRISSVGNLFRAEDESGECVGIYKSKFPQGRAQFTGE